MKAIRTILVMLIFSLFGSVGFAQKLNPDAIVGTWLVASKDGKIQIYKNSAGKYEGKIVWGEGGKSYDEKNPNPSLRTRPIIGLVILREFAFDGDEEWENGLIYDPNEGKEYKCVISLENYNTLKVRGYVGISLFGRTEKWTRIEK